jgi:hypothetical protein
MEFLFLLLIPLAIAAAILWRRRPGARGPDGTATLPDDARGIADTSHRTQNYGPGM